MTEIVLKPVGIIRSEIREPVLRSDKDGITLKEKLKHVRAERDKIRTMISEIVIDPALEEILEGIEEYSHIQVLFWAHKVPPESRKLTQVHPMGLKEMPKRGIFATCSPARPNPVLLTAVKLLERNANILKVQGLEAIDGTPVIDIKPYVKGYHCAENPKSPEWMEKIHAMLEDAA
ncbi:MAG: tRNA (N6-threonylcarbamoyladenosine(37)-N6)-methyltransferase TrmO [Desulfobacteraceae bacterium IS3]|nr:MAG: tRNA (N6-threonylcarbamoyladenosine(37)-N6)-methyltransferase TrmO [Desulfobacteraceae bacterium IS3]